MDAAGHDINYIALTGVLHGDRTCRAAKPVPPLNLVGDFGGGALYLAFGVVCGILEARKSGKGQVVDAAMTDGAASLMAMFYGMMAAGRVARCSVAANMLDSGAHFYDTTRETKDGKWGGRSVRSSRNSIASCSRKTGITDRGLRSTDGPQRLACTQTKDRGRDENGSDPRRMGRHHAGHDVSAMRQRLLGYRSAETSAQYGARHVHRNRWRHAARAGAMRSPVARSREVQGGARARPILGRASVQAWGFAPGEIAALKSAGAI